MRLFTNTEWGILGISCLQIISGLTLTVINTILVLREDLLMYRYRKSDHMFGKPEDELELNFFLVTMTLYVLALTLMGCGIFGILAVLNWRERSAFLIATFVGSFISLFCFASLIYVAVCVTAHQHNRLDSFKQVYRDAVSKQYASDPVLRDHYDKVQRHSQCCGFEEPQDWIRGTLGYIPISCCRHGTIDKCRHLGSKFDNQAMLAAGVAEAWSSGCYSDLEKREKTEGFVSCTFYGYIIGCGLLVQIIAVALTIYYKRRVITRPSHATRL